MNFNIEKKNNNSVLIKLDGRLIGDFQTIELNDRLDETLEENYNNIIFDLSELEYINSTGLSFFLKTLTKVRRQDGEVILCSLNALLNNLLVTTKLSSFFTICKDADEALNYLSKEKSL
ncbi:MAG: STAS domain-containing protein [Fimbriimonadaceae bacterium]|nr:STAS domain-containing protein [Chitinophagales bacterium]